MNFRFLGLVTFSATITANGGTSTLTFTPNSATGVRTNSKSTIFYTVPDYTTAEAGLSLLVKNQDETVYPIWTSLAGLGEVELHYSFKSDLVARFHRTTGGIWYPFPVNTSKAIEVTLRDDSAANITIASWRVFLMQVADL